MQTRVLFVAIALAALVTWAPDAAADIIFDRSGSAGSLFGFRVANAGDFNGDGLDDLIIGAPYEAGRLGRAP